MKWALGGPTHRGERTIRGIVVPAPVNAHTHLGDAVSVREPPPGPSRLIQPPHGYKFQLLARTSRAEKVGAIGPGKLR